MGYAYGGLGQYQDAIDAFSDYLVELDAVDLAAVYEIAVNYYRLENFEESLNAVEELLRYEPGDTEVLLLKAYNLEKLFRYDEAMEILEGILIIDPEHKKALEEVQFIKENGLE